MTSRFGPLAPINIAGARKVCAHLASLGQFPALTAFGSTGEVIPGFVGECRKLEHAKAELLHAKRISVETYWDLVRLDIFCNDHLDDGLARLRRAYARQASPSAQATALALSP